MSHSVHDLSENIGTVCALNFMELPETISVKEMWETIACFVMQLTVMNTRRLTSKGAAKIEQIGQPTNLLQSLGPYITGKFLSPALGKCPDKTHS